MTGRAIRLLILAFLVLVVLALAWTAEAYYWIPGAMAFWLWPILIAVLLLVLAIALWLMLDARWLLPLGVGFVVQATGLILLKLEVLRSRWEPLWHTLGAIGAVLLIILAFWLVRTIRARILERRMLQGLGGAEGGGEELARIRQDMMQALDLLRRAGRGRNAIYDLPWFLVMGRPAAGKSVAIRRSGLDLPVRQDRVKGVGGTYTCDWFFTNDLIFLDIPGKWVIEGTGEDAQSYWKQLLRLLRKYRGRRPLDGLIVAVPADDLLTKDEPELREQASHVREIVDLIHAELEFRFPIYLMVTKTDLVEGFVDFFRALPAQRHNEILGWSNENPGEPGAVASRVEEGFRRLQSRLEGYRVEMLGSEASRTKARRLFFFTEAFKELNRPLAVFCDALFHEDRFHETPVLRGFYFTSGTQGEGSPLNRAMDRWARAVGVRPSAAAADEERPRSYFLLDLFRELMVRDEGLVGRSALHWLRLRRNTVFSVFLPAVLALVILIAALTSFLLNAALYREVRREVPRIAEEAEAVPPDDKDVFAALARTRSLHTYHEKLSGFSLFRSFGMRRPGELAPETSTRFAQQFRATVLEPTLRAAEALATDPGESCIARIDVLHSVVWLRMGRRAPGFADLAGFDRVWDLQSPSRARRARDELLVQYRHYQRVDGASRATLLPGFSIRRVAQSIRNDCNEKGSTSTLVIFEKWEEQCDGATTGRQVTRCYRDLAAMLGNPDADYAGLEQHFLALKTDLAQLDGQEAEAQEALALLAPIDLAQTQTGTCLSGFDERLVPAIRGFIERKELIDECRDVVEDQEGTQEKLQARDRFSEDHAKRFGFEPLENQMNAFSANCRDNVPGFDGLQPKVLEDLVQDYVEVACFDPLEHAWADILRVYETSLEGRAPFAGRKAQPVSTRELIALLGGESGAVTHARSRAGADALSPESEAWLSHARLLSEILFEPGSDELREIPLTLTLEPARLSPEEFAKRAKLVAADIHFGEADTARFEWREDHNATKQLKLPMFGDDQSSKSWITVTLGRKKGFVESIFTKGSHKEDEPIEMASAEGFLAPVELVEQGLRKSGARAQDGVFVLRYTLANLPFKKNDPASVTLSIKLQSSDLSRVLQLANSGLGAPPPTAGG